MNGWKIDAWRVARRSAPTGAPIVDEGAGLQLVALSNASVRVLTRGVGHKVVVLCVDPPNVIEHYVPLVKILQAHARVVCLELPGTGWSQAKNGFRFSMDDHVRVVSELLDKMHVGKATFAFPCLTAFVALAVARKRPDLVGRLVLAQGAGYHEAVKWTRRIDGVGVLRVPFAGQLAAWAARKTIVKLFYENTTPEEGTSDERLATAGDAYRRGADWCCATEFQAFQVLDGRKISGVDLPAVVVWGEGDPSHRKTDRESMRRHLPQAQVVHFWGSGHFPDLDDPTRFAEHVLGVELAKEGPAVNGDAPLMAPLSSLESAIFSEDTHVAVPPEVAPPPIEDGIYTGETSVSVPPPPVAQPAPAPPVIAPQVIASPVIAPPVMAQQPAPPATQPVFAPPAQFASPSASKPAAPAPVAPPWASAAPAVPVAPVPARAPAPPASPPPAPGTESLELDVQRPTRRPAPSHTGRRPLATAAPGKKKKKKRAKQGVVSTTGRLVVGIAIFTGVLVWLDANIGGNTPLRGLVSSLPLQVYDPRFVALVLTATLATPALMWLLRGLNLLFPGERGLLAIVASAIVGVGYVAACLFAAIAVSCVLIRLATSPLPLLEAIRSFRGAGIRVEWHGALPLIVDSWRAIAVSGAGLGITCAVLAPRRP